MQDSPQQSLEGMKSLKLNTRLKLGGLKCVSFFSPARGMWEIIIVIVVVLSLCKGQEVRPLHLYFLPFLPLLSLLFPHSSFQLS